jgi:hypothetical protein
MRDSASPAKAPAGAGAAGGCIGGGDAGCTTTTTGLGAAGGALREHALNNIAKRTNDAVSTRIVFTPGLVAALCLCGPGQIEPEGVPA